MLSLPSGEGRVAFANGTEFVRHHRLHALGIETFFRDTHSPWRKRGVENAIGRMRRMLTRKTDPAEVTSERFDHLLHNYSNTSRKCLGYYTPAEMLAKNLCNQVSHLKCESTAGLSR